MPLSDHEQRLLEQIERALYAEDPKFASTVRTTDLRYFHLLGNRLLDHYLRGRGPRPPFDVRSAVTSCDPDRFGPVLRARNWAALHPAHKVLELGTVAVAMLELRSLELDGRWITLRS